MQQLEDFVARPGHHGLRFGFRRAIRPGQQRLRQLQIPVAIDVPDEAIGRGRRIVEAIGFDRLGDLGGGLRGLVRDPAVERFLRRLRIEARDARAAVHLGEARGVPQLGREIAVALDALRSRA